MSNKPIPIIRLTHEPLKPGWEKQYLLIADLHWDSPHCDRQKLHKHLKQAKERDAGIIAVGDIFDAMQGRGDPRSTKEELSGEFGVDDYLDELVDAGEEEFQEYKDWWEVVTLGNHEDSVLRHYGTNLARRFARRMAARYADYLGYIRFVFSGEGGGRTSRLMYFHHGGGAGGAVTKGALNVVRRAAYQPDADIIVTGHIHERWLHTVQRIRVSQRNIVYEDTQYHLQLPTYKDEWQPRGWPVRKEMPPKPKGGWWLKYFYDRSEPGRLGMDVSLAT